MVLAHDILRPNEAAMVLNENLRMKTLKPMIKDVERNKYVLEADKSPDHWLRPLCGRGHGHVTYFFKFWDHYLHNFLTDEARDFVFSLLDPPWQVLHSG